MSRSSQNAIPMLFAAAAVAWAILAAAPAVAEPGDSDIATPSAGDYPVPLSISTIDKLWNQYVPPNPLVPRSPVATFGPLVDQIFPLFR